MLVPRHRHILRWAAYQAAFSLFGLVFWIPATFGDVTIDQALWHIVYADGAAMMLSEVFYVECAVYVVLVPLLCALLATALHAEFARRRAGWQRRALRFAPATLGAGGVLAMAWQFSAFSYAAAYLEPDRFAQQFVHPRHVELVQERRRNLVVIYAESLESTYGDEALFGRDLLAPLRQVGGRSYDWYRPAAGATWTMAGIVATQCGVPLKVYSQTDVRVVGRERAFLPGTVCLGDVLQAHGYRNVFMGGVSLSFAGKGRFLRDHGYQEVWGREEWDATGARPEDYNAWGLWDSALFDRARAGLDRLHASGQPFNLTLLTLNTHNPFGFLGPACRQRGGVDFEGIVTCSAERIAEFISHARKRGYLKDTTIVVIGDHLAVPNPVYDRLVQAPRRGMFNLFVGDQLPPANTDQLMPFDMFPTLLELAGIRVVGDRLALGYSAVGHVEAEPPSGRGEDWSMAAVRGSARYDRLWSARTPAEGADD